MIGAAKRYLVALSIGGVATLFVPGAGCSSSGPKTASGPAATAPSSGGAAVAEKGRAQIWAENCTRCHNSRPPDWYNDPQWGVAMMHMRVRGYLTGQEHKAVLEFLQAGNN